MAAQPDISATYFLSRANAAHIAMLATGLVALIQSIVFCNMIIGTQPIYCRISDPASRGAVYAFLGIFLIGYYVAIRVFAGLDATYRERAGLVADPLANRSKFLVHGLNVATTLSAMGVYTANMFLNTNPELCA